jgi:hypothetical protein
LFALSLTITIPDTPDWSRACLHRTVRELSKPDKTAEEVQQQLQQYQQRGGTQLAAGLRLEPRSMVEDALASGLRNQPGEVALEAFACVPKQEQAPLLRAMLSDSTLQPSEQVAAQAALRCKQADMTNLLDKLTAAVASGR